MAAARMVTFRVYAVATNGRQVCSCCQYVGGISSASIQAQLEGLDGLNSEGSTALQRQFMKQGAAKSLTRSGGGILMLLVRDQQLVKPRPSLASHQIHGAVSM